MTPFLIVELSVIDYALSLTFASYDALRRYEMNLGVDTKHDLHSVGERSLLLIPFLQRL